MTSFALLQVAAQALAVPLSCVYIAETSTDKVPNASPTAASASSDMYGGAILDACQQLTARLAPYRAKLGPSAPFVDVSNAAYLDRVDLCAHGFYATPDVTGKLSLPSDWQWLHGKCLVVKLFLRTVKTCRTLYVNKIGCSDVRA